ncbi:LysR family transcriptional regulator [Roseivivax sp. CAU 1753]
MDNWDDLRFLVALSRTGTMTAAAKLLGTNTATVSRRIERLSDSLGEAAFVKTAGGWRPSSSVTKLIDLAQTFDGELQSTLNARDRSGTGECVSINIGAPPVVSAQVLMPSLRDPDLYLDGITVTFTDRLLREGLGEHDVVLQMGAPEVGRIVTRKAGTMHFNLFGPVTDGTNRKGWIGLSETYESTPVQRMGYDYFDQPPRLRVENFASMHKLIHVTRLPGSLPDVIGMQDPELTYVDKTRASYPAEFWLMYHETRRSDPVMRRVVDWIMDCFARLETEQRPKAREAT